MALLEGEGIVLLLLFLFWVWALFDCISTDAVLCRNLPKGVWLILVLVLPDIGSLAWLLIGRPEKAGWKPGSPRSGRRPMGLEDHPRYSGTPDVTERRSAELDARLAQWEREQAAQRAPAPGELESGEKASGANAPADASSAANAGVHDLDAWESDLSRRETELRQRELEVRERELRQREDDLGE